MGGTPRHERPVFARVRPPPAAEWRSYRLPTQCLLEQAGLAVGTYIPKPQAAAVGLGMGGSCLVATPTPLSAPGKSMAPDAV